MICFVYSFTFKWFTMFHTPVYTDTDLVRGYESWQRSSGCLCWFGTQSVLQTCCSECAILGCGLQQVFGSADQVSASGFGSHMTIWWVFCGLGLLDKLWTKQKKQLYPYPNFHNRGNINAGKSWLLLCYSYQLHHKQNKNALFWTQNYFINKPQFWWNKTELWWQAE